MVVLVLTRNGELKEEGFMLKGEKNGKWVKFNTLGKKIGKAEWSNGKKNGTLHIFDEQGNKRFEMFYKNGERSRLGRFGMRMEK